MQERAREIDHARERKLLALEAMWMAAPVLKPATTVFDRRFHSGDTSNRLRRDLHGHRYWFQMKVEQPGGE
jgi:hypothetical protein